MFLSQKSLVFRHQNAQLFVFTKDLRQLCPRGPLRRRCVEQVPGSVLKQSASQSVHFEGCFGASQCDAISRNVKISTVVFVFTTPPRRIDLRTSNLLSVAGLVRARVLKQSAVQSDKIANLGVDYTSNRAKLVSPSEIV